MKSETTNTSILDRFNQSESDDAVYQSDGDYKAFGISRHAVSLNCIRKDGSQVGISWSLFSDATYDPETGIKIEFSHKTVKIEGSNLLPLYQYVLGNRVTFIAEADKATEMLVSGDGETSVRILEIRHTNK